RVRAHQALGPAGPDDRHALGDRRHLLARALGEQDLERERGERAGVVVDAAVALRLAENRNDVLGAERARVEQSGGFADVVWGAHTNLECLGIHRDVLLGDEVRCDSPGRRARPHRSRLARSAISAARARSKQARGGLTRPAPIWPMPASRWAMPVLICGRIPVCATIRTSMPVGVPRKSSAGMRYATLSPSVISYIVRVNLSASDGVPPTNCTTAGAPPIAKPPRPAVSVIALSPMSGLASAGP